MLLQTSTKSMRILKLTFISLVSLITVGTSKDYGIGIVATGLKQKLSHFDNVNITFQQRYVVEGDEYYKQGGPIFVFLGGDFPINYYFGGVGIIRKSCKKFNALSAYIEHRFYGESVPLGSLEAALASPNVRKYLNVDEALADFATIILSIKVEYSVINAPVIVVGTLYSGILAAWFRLKYPHIAIGALASSAPMYFFRDPSPGNDYCSILTQDFEQVPNCANVIRKSFATIDEIASRPQGLEILSRRFNFCRGQYLGSLQQLKMILAGLYSTTAASNYYDPNNNRVKTTCDVILEASRHNDTLAGIAQVLRSWNNATCFTNFHSGSDSGIPFIQSFALKQQLAWNWQSCSEIPILHSCTGKNSMIPHEAFHSRARHYKGCWKKYHVMPSKNWLWTPIQDLKKGSNIIFSNGLMDPYSSLGILVNISDTIVVLNTKEGSQSPEIPFQHDSPWLVKFVEKEINIFEKWINTYNSAEKIMSSNVVFVLLVVLPFLCLS